MTIPKQLQNKDFRYILIANKKKTAIEVAWTLTDIDYTRQTDSSWRHNQSGKLYISKGKVYKGDLHTYQYDNETLLKHIEKQKNYGVLCGHGGIIAVDFDDSETQDKVINEFPETFTVKSGGKGLNHAYYIITDEMFDKFPIKNHEQKTLIDVQAKGGQVVGPGSEHESGRFYEVIKDVEIKKLTKKEFADILIKIFPGYDIPIVFDEFKKTIEKNNKNPLVNKIKQKVSINSILEKKGINIQINPTMCPLGHYSESQKCFGHNNDLWHCFNCGKGGDVITLYEEIHKIDFKQAVDLLCEEYDIKKDIISDDNTLRNMVLQLIVKNETREATELLVKAFLNREIVYTTRNDEKSEIWIYQEGIYIPHGKTYIKEFCRDILQSVYTISIVNETTNKIETDTYIEQDKFFQVKDIYKIPVMNGVLDVQTRELMDYNPEYFMFQKIPVTYDIEKDCPNIKKFFSEITEHESDVQILQEIIGYCLIKDYPIEKAFMFLGTGRNGKGKTVEVIKRFLGINNVSSILLQDFEKSNFTMYNLHNKLANLGDDLSATSLKETGPFKSLTGRGLITADRKHKTSISFTNYAKMIFCANELPKTYDNTPAFFNRWILLNFPYTFLDQKEIDLREDKEFLKLQDPNIINKISTDEELSGLLNWVLDGLERVAKNKRFSYNHSTSEVKKMWMRKSNSLEAFIEDEMVEDYDSFVTKQEFRQKYHDYCKNWKLKKEGDKVIKNTISIAHGAAEEYKSVNGGNIWCWVGIKFKNQISKKVDIEVI